MRPARSLVWLLLVAVLVGCAWPPAEPSGNGTSAPGPTRPLVAPDSALEPPPGMATVTLADLPPEARETLGLIAAGGPYPYRQDGAVFENRERLLPGRPTGHYREFTVVTPGEGDRGARRIVTGAAGERYYTDDHYDSFRWIVP